MRRRILVAATAVTAVVAGGGVAYAQAQGSSGSYRTALVAIGDVDRTLMLSGTIAASARQDLSFGVGGTVAKVRVEVGEVVRAGAALAAVDETDLRTAVTKARATLAKAEAQLEADRDSQSSTVTDAATGGSGSGSPSAGSGSESKPSSGSANAVSPKLKAALAALRKQQGDVLAAQTDATSAIAAAKSALAAQTEACKKAGDEEPADSADESAGLSDECTVALGAVQAGQDVVAGKQATLQAALEVLSRTLTGAVAELQKPTGGEAGSASPTDGTGAGAPTPGTGSSTGAGAGSGDGPTVTAASLAQDQASIDTAKAALTEAKRNRDAAVLTAPFSGRILSVAAAKGDTVTATDVMLVIVGDGDTTVTTTVTSDQVSEVEKGQTASVTPAGASKAVIGTVTSIGLLPDSGSDTTAYPVTLELSGGVAAPEGSTASIALVIGTAKDVLTVPSSAVSTTGRTTVSVLTDGRVVRTPVTVGVVGPTRTSVTRGLKQGQEVVVADLDAELPSGDGTTRFPGGGFPGAPGGGRQSRAAG